MPVDKPVTIVGSVADQPVVQFTPGTPYLLVRRDKVRTLTAVEAATLGKAEEDAVSAVYDTGEKKPLPEFSAKADGQGQYL